MKQLLREAAIAREKHLLSLVCREQKLWAKVDALITTTQPTSYDLAVEILVDLRDSDARGKGDSFESRMKTLRQAREGRAVMTARDIPRTRFPLWPRGIARLNDCIMPQAQRCRLAIDPIWQGYDTVTRRARTISFADVAPQHF